MTMAANGVPIRILDREFVIACSDEERDDVMASARYVNGKIDEIKRSAKVIGTDRLVVLAALNIANDLLHTQAECDRYENSFHKLSSIQRKIEATLEAAD